MQYSKPMIDLVYEIRRRVDSEMKPGIKLANPEMLQDLANFHHHCKDTVTKTLIKELLLLAGAPWNLQLQAPQPHTQPSQSQSKTPKQLAHIYRGQVSLVDAPIQDSLAQDIPKEPLPRKPVRIYRGQVVEY